MTRRTQLDATPRSGERQFRVGFVNIFQIYSHLETIDAELGFQADAPAQNSLVYRTRAPLITRCFGAVRSDPDERKGRNGRQSSQQP